MIARKVTAGIPHGAIIADKMNLPFAYIFVANQHSRCWYQIEGRVHKAKRWSCEDLILLVVLFYAVAAAKREGAGVLVS